MGKNLFHTIIVVVLLAQQSVSQDFRRIEAKVESLIEKGVLPSMVIGVLKDGEILYEKAFGYSDIENGEKSSIHTPYKLASLSKPITASAIMKLHEDGLINLEDPITKYVSLKKVDSTFSDPTIRQVMNHTAGLGTYFDIYYADETFDSVPFEDAWAQYGTQFHEAGKVCEYSNLGYGLLDFIVSKVNSHSFEDYVHANIFNSLGMNDAFLIGSTVVEGKRPAKSYGPKRKPLPHLWTNTPGAGNIAASIHDILLFGSTHLQTQPNNLLQASSIQEMHTYKEANALFHYYQDTFYGLGWYVMENDKGHKVVWHEGGMMGASSVLKIYPKEKIAIALLTNTFSPQSCRALSDMIANLVLENYEPTPINEISEYQPLSSDTSFEGLWKGTMKIDQQEVPISLTIANNSIQLSYLDEGYASFLTDYQPLPFNSQLLFGLVNQGYFVGTGVGELSASYKRGCNTHLLSFKLFKTGNSLKGQIISLAAADREYYALPYSIALEKAIANK